MIPAYLMDKEQWGMFLLETKEEEMSVEEYQERVEEQERHYREDKENIINDI